MKNTFENPFRKSSPSEEFTPDADVLAVVMAKAKEIAPDAPDAEIRESAIRAMRAADKDGKPFTTESFKGNDGDSDSLLKKAIEIQKDMPKGALLVNESTGEVVRKVRSNTEAMQYMEKDGEAA